MYLVCIQIFSVFFWKNLNTTLSFWNYLTFSILFFSEKNCTGNFQSNICMESEKMENFPSKLKVNKKTFLKIRHKFWNNIFFSKMVNHNFSFEFFQGIIITLLISLSDISLALDGENKRKKTINTLGPWFMRTSLMLSLLQGNSSLN